MADTRCLICADTKIDLQHVSSPPGLECCNSAPLCCSACLYRHIQSIVGEAITGPRYTMLCPFGCRSAISNQVVLDTIFHQHQVVRDSEVRRAILHDTTQQPCGNVRSKGSTSITFNGIKITGFAASVRSGCMRDYRPSSWRSTITNRRVTTNPPALRQHAGLAWIASSENLFSCKDDIDRYFEWSMIVALRSSAADEQIMRCPREFCSYMWLYNPAYRRYKEGVEAKTTFVWFSPPTPEKEKSNDVDDWWAIPEEIVLNEAALFNKPRRNKSDGRCMLCPNCQLLFCALCQSDWDGHVEGVHWYNPNHSGKSCEMHRQRQQALVDQSLAHRRQHQQALADRNFVGVHTPRAAPQSTSLITTRNCPSCAVSISRIDGCNHMTCHCGFEFCYECEVLWSSSHMQCKPKKVSFGWGRRGGRSR